MSVGRCHPCVAMAGWVVLTTIISKFQHDFEISPRPYLVLDPRPGLHIVDINDAYGRVTMTARRAIAGEKLFATAPADADPELSIYDNGEYHALVFTADVIGGNDVTDGANH